MAETPSSDSPRIWRWAGWSLASWAAFIYLLIILAFALPRPLTGPFSFPVYTPAEYVQGSYPLFWLVYFWLPLFCRDIYISRKNRSRLSNELKIFSALVLLSSLTAYKFIFGWF